MADKKTYSDKLKDPRWQKKRLEIFNRDGFKCTTCGRGDKTLHVHHKFYESGLEPWQYDDSVLTTLCEECHFNVPEQEAEFKNLIKFLLCQGFSYLNLVRMLSGAAVQTDVIEPGDIASYIDWVFTRRDVMQAIIKQKDKEWEDFENSPDIDDLVDYRTANPINDL